MKQLKTYIQNLTNFSDDSWKILEDCLTEINLKRSNKLLKVHEVCSTIYFIELGFCKAVYNKEGKEINVAFYFENDFVTNTKSIIDSSKSEYEIVVCENLTAVKIDKAKLLNAYKKSREIEGFGRKLLEIIVSKQEEHANSFKLLTPLQRYQNLVLTQPAFLQRISLTQIASYLGISRETLSRIRAKV